jgi:hypothetical protein
MLRFVIYTLAGTGFSIPVFMLFLKSIGIAKVGEPVDMGSLERPGRKVPYWFFVISTCLVFGLFCAIMGSI